MGVWGQSQIHGSINLIVLFLKNGINLINMLKEWKIPKINREYLGKIGKYWIGSSRNMVMYQYIL